MFFVFKRQKKCPASVFWALESMENKQTSKFLAKMKTLGSYGCLLIPQIVLQMVWKSFQNFWEVNT